MARFMRKGVVKVFFVPTVANLTTGITLTEIGAGVELGPELAEVNGFAYTNSPISTPDMDNQFVSQITGEDTADQSSMTFYDGDDPDTPDAQNTIKAALPKGTAGFIVFFYAGIAGAAPAVDDYYEAFPVTVSSAPRMYDAGNVAAQFRVDMAITAVPEEGQIVS